MVESQQVQHRRVEVVDGVAVLLRSIAEVVGRANRRERVNGNRGRSWGVSPRRAVTGAADKVLRVAAVPPYLLHLEFVSGHDSAVLPRKLHTRNSLLEDRHDLPVLSGVLLLRPEADSPQLTGTYQRGFPGKEPYLTFRYEVVRVWRLSPDPLLAGELVLLPLALISDVTEDDLPGIMKRIAQRLSGRRARKQAEVVWSAAYILLGLRYSEILADQLFQGVRSMEESSTYQGRRVTEAATAGNLGGIPLFIRAGEIINLYHPHVSLVTAAGPVRVTGLGLTVLFAAGPVEVHDVSESIIVSGGDVKVSGQVRGSLIIARGSVTYRAMLEDSRIVSGKSVVAYGPHFKLKNVIVNENDPIPLGFVRFFDPAREGVVVEGAKGGVRVKTVDAGKPFAKAGVRVGDVITAVQGEAVDSPDTFRRLLRRALAVDESCTLGVLRSGKGLDVRVPSPQ